MRNFKVILQYEGTKYQGWQRQDTTDNTLQGKLETLLTKMCGKRVEVHGSGRTDAGVHALGQTANFHLDTEMQPADLMRYMNQYLPEDVAVIAIAEVEERFHSRLHAKGKTYRYRVLNTDIPHIFDRRYVYVFPRSLDVEAMRKAAVYLTGTHDFKAFTSNRRTKKSSVRTITSIRIERTGEEIWFTYEGSGFLYHMARIITGTLLEVGTGQRAPEEIPAILQSGARENAGALVPAKGLTLVEVRYEL